MSFFKFISFKVLMPLFYDLGKLKKLKEKKVVFVEISAPVMTDSFSLLYEKFSGEFDTEVSFLHNGSVTSAAYLKNSLKLLFQVADAKYVFINEASNVLSAVRLREGSSVIQTWHGCGAFKKFGFSTAELSWGVSLSEMEKYPYYKNLSLVTVSSPECIKAYKDAMRVDEDIIRPTGVSRTDYYFRKKSDILAKRRFEELFPEAGGYKVILFAPTFRGTQKEAVSVELDYRKLKGALSDRFVLVIKEHPFVREKAWIPEDCYGFARDLTGEMSIEELMLRADICVTDYSSLIFEYSLLLRPMIFYAPDLEKYYDERGFYYSYEELTPGPVTRTMDELIAAVKDFDRGFDERQVKEFRDRFMGSCDGNSTERIYDAVLNL